MTHFFTFCVPKVYLFTVSQVSGQFSQRLFRKLPPRVCVPLKNIISEEILRSGSVFVPLFVSYQECMTHIFG